MTPNMLKALALIRSTGGRIKCEVWMQRVPEPTRAALHRRGLVKITPPSHGHQRYVVGRRT